MSRAVGLILGLLLAPLLATLVIADTEGGSLQDFDKLWNYREPAETEKRFRELLPDVLATGDASLRAQLLSQIARSQGLQRDFDAAHATLDEAEALLGDGMSLARVRVLLERGRTLNSGGDPPKSIPLFREALTIAKAEGYEFHAVDAAHMLGIVEEPEAALEWNLKAIALAEAASEERARGWLGALYNNTGWTLHSKGEYEKALELFEKALAWREEKGQELQTRIAKWCVARCLRSLDRVEEALARQRALLAEIEEAGIEQDGFVFEELGECLHALGKTEEARPWFRKAHALLSEDAWLSADEPERLERLKRLGGEGD